MLEMPNLETDRLIIRPFEMDDLPEVHHLLDVELVDASLHSDRMEELTERREWLQWAVLNRVQLAKLYQPPYGDRAVILKATGELIGACGYVPCLAPFEQLPGFTPGQSLGMSAPFTTEFGLFYAISPLHQRRGYASEAAAALVEYAFQNLRLKRVVATTDYDNIGSIGVMRKLRMRIEKNPLSTPPWLQVVGVLENQY
jgi:[ribosomal protein S5]-alanine N-acetyltransferase